VVASPSSQRHNPSTDCAHRANAQPNATDDDVANGIHSPHDATHDTHDTQTTDETPEAT
jgi:hypothetical protein